MLCRWSLSCSSWQDTLRSKRKWEGCCVLVDVLKAQVADYWVSLLKQEQRVQFVSLDCSQRQLTACVGVAQPDASSWARC